MASGAKKGLFDGDDDDIDEIPKLKRGTAKKVGEENPLSFFSFGSAASAPPTHPKPSSQNNNASTSFDTDDDDDDFFTSPPSSMKKQKPSLSDDDDLYPSSLPKTSIVDPKLSFQDALRPEPSRSAPADALSDKQRILALEEQLAKANRTIKKLQEKEKADAIQLEQALQGIETNIAKYVERANKAEAEKNRLEQEYGRTKEMVMQLQAQTRQQAALISQMNLGGIPIPTASPSELDWYTVHEKHQMALRMLTQASQEAKTGIELLLKNAPILQEVTLLLKDSGKISEERGK